MFLLFFLMVAAGMLSLLWLYFPVQGGPPPEDPLPPRQQFMTPGVAAPEPAVPAASIADASADAEATTGGAAAGTPATAADATSRAPAAMDVPGSIGAAPSGSERTTDAQAGMPTPPALPTIEALDQQLDRLLGLPPSPPARP